MTGHGDDANDRGTNGSDAPDSSQHNIDRDREWMRRIGAGGQDGADALFALFSCYRTTLRAKLRRHGVADWACDDVLKDFLLDELLTGTARQRRAGPPLRWLRACMHLRAKAWHRARDQDPLDLADPLADPDNVVRHSDAETALPGDAASNPGMTARAPSDRPDPTFDTVARRQQLAQLRQDIARAHAKGGKWAAAIALVELVRRHRWTKADVARYLFELCYTRCEKNPCSRAQCDNGTERAAENALRNARNLLQPYFNRRNNGSPNGSAAKGG